MAFDRALILEDHHASGGVDPDTAQIVRGVKSSSVLKLDIGGLGLLHME